ncbi:MAG: hypothetical protein ACPGVG_05625 [Mycobacterium sp.]
MNRELDPIARMAAAGAEVGKSPVESVGARPGMRVRISARGSVADRFEFIEVYWDVATAAYIDHPTGITHATLGECVSRGRMLASGMGMLFVGLVVWLEPGDQFDTDGRQLWEFTPPPMTMPVSVSKSGGVNGDVSTKATIVYNVFAEDGEQLLSGVSPQNQRPDKGEVIPATDGEVVYKLVGGVATLTLGDVNEVSNLFSGGQPPPPYTPGTPDPPYVPSGTADDDVLVWDNGNGRWVKQATVTQTVLTGVSWNATTAELEFTRETLTIIAKAGSVADTDITFYDCDGNTA